MTREEIKIKILSLIANSTQQGVTKDKIVAHVYEDAYANARHPRNSWWANVSAHNLIDKLVQQLRKDGLIIYDRPELVWRSVLCQSGRVLQSVFADFNLGTDIEDEISEKQVEMWQRVADEYERRKKYGGRNA